MRSIQDTAKDPVAWQSAALRSALLPSKGMVLFKNLLSLAYYPLNSTCSLYFDWLRPPAKAVVRSVHSKYYLGVVNSCPVWIQTKFYTLGFTVRHIYWYVACPGFSKWKIVVPFGQLFRNFGQHFQFESFFVIDSCRALRCIVWRICWCFTWSVSSNGKLFAPFRHRRCDVPWVAWCRYIPFIVTLVNMDNFRQTYLIDRCKAL